MARLDVSNFPPQGDFQRSGHVVNFLVHRNVTECKCASGSFGHRLERTHRSFTFESIKHEIPKGRFKHPKNFLPHRHTSRILYQCKLYISTHCRTALLSGKIRNFPNFAAPQCGAAMSGNVTLMLIQNLCCMAVRQKEFRMC